MVCTFGGYYRNALNLKTALKRMDTVLEVYPECDNEYELKRLLQTSMATQIDAIRERGIEKAQIIQTTVKTLQSTLTQAQEHEKQLEGDLASRNDELQKVSVEFAKASKELEYMRTNDKIYQNFFKVQKKNNNTHTHTKRLHTYTYNLNGRAICSEESAQNVLVSLQNEKEQMNKQVQTLKDENTSLTQQQQSLTKQIESLENENVKLRLR
ncbi:sarcolemma associated protein [Reticulomyxa filosa]|uniref:Sarcolemma associated protein n=1 Tax=Reticulomyxa filosa TaxID=46433 RepID=X6P1Z5_RETFI|nr:sarcolemma associated protein [Reticulomyxa filosa]|eukprot:ETO31577.1 sarcolemma associated protein [Reticulomyxa filosa]